MKTILAAVAALSLAGAARAEVVDQSPQGFESLHTLTIAAPPAKVRAATLEVGRWWSSAHSWSGDARNLSIDLATGCFCEKLHDDRSATSVARVVAGLAVGTTTISATLDGKVGTTVLTVTYDVGGYAKGGLAEQWAKPVDGVIGEQVGRLKMLLETGKTG